VSHHSGPRRSEGLSRWDGPTVLYDESLPPGLILGTGQDDPGEHASKGAERPGRSDPTQLARNVQFHYSLS
jgi:hypothetical protein